MASGTVVAIAEEIGRALCTLRPALESPAAFKGLALRLGWNLETIPAPIQELAGSVATLESALLPFYSGTEPSESEIATLLATVPATVDAITALSGASFDPALVAEGFADEFPQRVIDFVVTEYLTLHHPGVAFGARTLGLIRDVYIQPAGLRPGYLRREITWPDFGKILHDPVLLLQNAYGWRTADFEAHTFLRAVADLLASAKVYCELEQMAEDKAERVEGAGLVEGRPARWCLNAPLYVDQTESGALETGVRLMPLPATGVHLPGLALLPYALGDFGQRFQLDDHLFLTLRSSLDLEGGVAIRVRPDEPIDILVGFEADTPSRASGTLSGRVEYIDPAMEPRVLLGSTTGTRLETRTVSGVGALQLDAAGAPELFVEFELSGCRFVIAAGEDTFLKSLIPSQGIAVSLDLAIGLSTRRGVYFRGGTGLKVTQPIHAALGPINIRSLTVAVAASGAEFPVEISVELAARLGPVTAIVDGVGLQATFAFPGHGGNLGVANLDLDFKHPAGLSLAIEAPSVRGGGALGYSSATGEYFGGLELTINELVSVKAIGVVGTKMPDGSRGFSFAAVITVSDFPAINLGFGFRLTGVGGIVGLDRTFDFARLEENLKRGTLRNLLFPPNPVANATAIFADMTQVFPAARDHYVFGLMFRITWGSEKLVVIDLAVIIAESVAILGIVEVYFPRFDFAQVEIHVHVIGELDVGRKRIFVHAEIINTSHIFGFKLSGGAAMLLTWGEQPVFILSFGGFNKRYEQQLPPGFPALDRLTVQLVDTKNLKATLRVYLAVTSNSVQIGGSFALKAGVGKFTIKGALTVDALLQFYAKPRFIFELDAWLELKAWGVTLFSVRVRGTLSGGSPWHARGKATFKIWIFSCSVDFDEVWGDDAAEESLPEADVRSLVIGAFKDSRNWTAELPPETQGLVTLREPVSDTATLHPLGALAIAQRVAPLNVSLTRFGNARPQGQNFFRIEKVLVGTYNILEGSASFNVGPVTEHFARSQFLDMTDDEKLESPAFEKMDCGVRLGTAPVRHAAPLTAPVKYQTLKYNRTTKKLDDAGVKNISDTLLNQLVGTGAAASAPSAVRRGVPPPAVRIAPFKYVVANVKNQSPVTEDRASTYTQAAELMRAKVAAKTHGKSDLQVLEVTK